MYMSRAVFNTIHKIKRVNSFCDCPDNIDEDKTIYLVNVGGIGVYS